MATNKKGGPQTSAGKAVSSKNSTKHGLTSQAPSSSKEKEIISGYIQELTTHYKPGSPLEKIQIERIAICKAKLDRLYEVERVQLELAIKKFIQNPEQILDQIPLAQGAVRGMVIELIQYGEITLPCKLTDKELEIICEETLHYRKNIVKEGDLEVYWPTLTSFLKSYEPIYLSNVDSNALKKLDLVAQGIKSALGKEGKYSERYQNLVNLAVKLEELAEPMPAPPTEHDLAFDKFIQEKKEAREVERRKRHPDKKEPEVVVKSEPLIDQDKLAEQLNSFINLLRIRNQSLKVYEQYQSIKELMVQGVVLPQKESDLLMRYQTTLDRRLSTAIGELLHLQSKRISS